MLTPSRAAFLSSGTADFHPPDWCVDQRSDDCVYGGALFVRNGDEMGGLTLTAILWLDIRACAPLETNAHARLEAYRDSRHCATYMISTKKVNVFGRDQENCDHVLGNPSVSRKHAAIIHDEKGGIYVSALLRQDDEAYLFVFVAKTPTVAVGLL